MKTLPTLTLAAILAAAGFYILWQAEHLGAQPPASSKPLAGPNPATGKDSPAQLELRRSQELLKKRKSIDARVALNLNLLAYGFAGQGRYVMGADHKLLYEIEIQLPHTTGRLLEVCDGEILYTRHEIRPKKSAAAAKTDSKTAKADEKDKPKAGEPHIEVTVTRRNVRKILDHLEQQTDVNLYQQWVVDLGLGGLPALLASLDRSMQFTDMKTETLRGRAVNVIEGTWTDLQRSKWTPPDQKTRSLTLPPTVPDLGRLYIDQETGFPHRIVFLKRVPESKGLRTMAAVDFLDVALDGPVDEKLFVYKEDEAHPAQELTEDIISRIQAAQSQGPGQ